MNKGSAESVKLDRRVVISVTMTVMGIIAYIILSYVTSTMLTDEAINFHLLWAPLLVTVLLASLFYCVFLIFKIHGWLRIIPLVCAIINILLGSVVAFFYAFVAMY